MAATDDLFDAYRSDRERRRATLEGEGYAQALAANVRRAFSLMEKLAAEVGDALATAGYTIKLAHGVMDRSAYMRVDRTSEGFLDYLRSWSAVRTGQPPQGLHWEGQITVRDYRGSTAEIGLGVTIERPTGEEDADAAFVEFWTTGDGMQIPSGAKAFQRAIVNSVIRLEDSGALRSRQPRA
ncbi:hypothetical protein [Arenibaculum pallidiluteum]|uniref:hypothetical protein n=1 Tax=Arenibaculum pallidiluteum TaxID=2812559 RepID=UPI001A97D1F7|nr:hypothetical protein [Arenibaculum pallidiluteum]